MKISKVNAVYISPTGNVKKVTSAIAERAAKVLDVPLGSDDFTLPETRGSVRNYEPDELVIFGTPVYAGRVPNKFLPFVQELFKADGALAVPVVCFGNRNFDNALIELRNQLELNGFHTIAGAGVVTEHVFSDQLAPGRPDGSDMEQLKKFAEEIAAKTSSIDADNIPAPITVRGDDPVGPYYTPLGIDGKPAVFLKAKPKTKEDICTGCGTCVKTCPMGSISAEDPSQVTGICIKCHACIKKCPTGAKYFDDPAFLSHVEMLRSNYSRRSESELFL